jgi:hypothetical protein
VQITKNKNLRHPSNITRIIAQKMSPFNAKYDFVTTEILRIRLTCISDDFDENERNLLQIKENVTLLGNAGLDLASSPMLHSQMLEFYFVKQFFVCE